MLVSRDKKYVNIISYLYHYSKIIIITFLAFSNVGLLRRKALSVKCLVKNNKTRTKHSQFKSVYSIVKHQQKQ